MTELRILIDEHALSYPGRYFAVIDDSAQHIVIEGQKCGALVLVTGWGDTPLAAAENLFRECINYLQKEGEQR